MTEAEWNLCVDSKVMLNALYDKASDRKLRLLAVACYSVGSLRTPLNDAEMEAQERYADGLISINEVQAAHDAHFRYLFPEDQDDSLFGTVEDAAEIAHSEITRTKEATSKGPLFVRDIFGPLPFRPVTCDLHCLASAVTALAQAIYADRAFDRLPILADALEDAGCTDPDILAHCRGPGPHVRGCWVVDLLTGKA